MEIKFKENVNVESFTFKKAVEEGVLSMIEQNNKYLYNDICFYTMIAFLDNLCENDAIIDLLSDEGSALDSIKDKIEPLFKEKVIDSEEYLKIFNDIVKDLDNYYHDDVLNKRTISGALYSISDIFGGLKLSDIEVLLNNILAGIKQNAEKFNIDLPEIKTKTDELLNKNQSIADKAKEDIDNIKMKALVEKYTKIDNEANTTEE